MAAGPGGHFFSNSEPRIPPVLTNMSSVGPIRHHYVRTARGKEFAEPAPWMAIFPGLTISAAVFAFNVLGDALRDLLGPKLRMA